MLHDKPIGHLLLILFTSTLGANILGEALRVLLGFIAGSDTIVERALLQYVTYSIGPHWLNLIILSFSFEAFQLTAVFLRRRRRGMPTEEGV